MFTSSLKMFLRDRQGWFWSLFIPLLIMTVLGLMNFDELGSVSLGIADRASNELSGQLIEALKQVQVLDIHQGAEEELREKIEDGDLDILLTLPEDLSLQKPLSTGKAQPLELLYNEAKPEQVGTGTLVINQILTQFSMQATQTRPLFILQQKSVDSRNLGYMDFIVPGIVGMMIMQLGIIGVAMIVVRYREREILKRLRVTPINLSVFLASLISTRLLLLLIQAGLVIGMGKLFFGLHLYGNLFYIFLTALLGSLVFLGIGFTISGIASSMSTAMALAQMIQLPMMFLSGIYFPRGAFPEWLYKATDYLPLTYLADALRKTMIENANLVDIRSQLIPLALWGVAGFVLSTRLFRWE